MNPPLHEITYLTGDATNPIGDGPKIVAHVCNDIGGWGRGFVVALARQWPEPEAAYRRWHHGGEALPFELGQTQFVPVGHAVWVANMIAQRDTRPINGTPPIRYDALRQALQRVAAFAREHGASVHMPRIGCGLAGGEWTIVSQLIADELGANAIAVFVYDLAAAAPAPTKHWQPTAPQTRH